MRKGKVAWIAVVLVLVMIMAGCSSGKSKDAGTEGTKVTGSDKITVTFYDADGTTVLKTEEVEAGRTVKEYTPEKEGFTFMGWFATPQMQHSYDFTKALTENTSVFAGFVQYKEDTREFSIVGSGKSPVLMTSDWGKIFGEEHKLTKAEGKNEYSITLDLYEGDEFQFAINSAWNNQRGYGYLDTIAKDEKEYFVNSGGLGDTSSKRSNIKIAITGNYTFTLSTNPADDVYETENANYSEENKEAFNINAYDKITWVYHGDPIEPLTDMQTDYYIKGSGITNWQDSYSDRTKFVNAEGSYTLVIALKQGEEFLFTSLVTTGETSVAGTEYIRYSNLDEASSVLFDKTDSYNMVAKSNGLYTFIYDPSAAVLTATCDAEQFLPKCDYYIKGTFGGTNWETEGNKEYQLAETEAGSGIYVLKALAVEAEDEMGVQSINGEERLQFINYNAMAAASEQNANVDFEPHSNGYGNIVAKQAGTYQVTYNVYTGELTFSK